MGLLALCLVLSSSLLHATWNLQAKRAGGGAPFVFIVAAAASVIYAPVVAGYLLWQRPQLGLVHFGLILGSGLLQLGYFLVLQRGYQVGDLSLVYPLARGTGPALATAGAILILGERPSVLALIGAGLIVVGVLLIASGSSGGPAYARRRGVGIAYGLMTGVFIAAYTLWDKNAVSGAHVVPPLVLDYGSGVVRVAALWPLARGRWTEVAGHWTVHRRQVLSVAILSPIAFILVLTAMQMAPVSYVAPARELSILIGVVLGAKLLDEGNVRRRLVASGIMLGGILMLAVG